MKTQITLAPLFGLLFAGSALANTYLNYGVQDQANFVGENGQAAQVKISQTSGNWKKYDSFIGAGATWLYATAADETLYIFNEEQRIAQKLVNFADPVGKTYSFKLGACNTGGKIEAKGLTLNTLAGNFTNVVKMSFDSKCADGGTLEAWFAPKVGVVKWAQQSIVGPQNWNISSAKVEGKNYGFATLQSAIRSSADFPKTNFVFHTEAPKAEAYLNIRNVSNQELVLAFASGQEFDVTLLDAQRRVVNAWSANKRFIQAFHDVAIAPGETKRFGASVDLINLETGLPVQGGQYFLKVELKSAYGRFAGQQQSLSVSAEIPVLVARAK
ncbi:BsuPI-related putative proteinase inhibitor [Massilia sp. W12]|uniref:BsuPI-related putative proteinase inhibitor n=1 Tax=Massilia sp. W12 TaxID=3126507 RepID=UPI0030D47E3F